MKKYAMLLLLVLLSVMLLTSCGGNKEQKITCTMCNGSGEVKYYYARATMITTWDRVQAVTKRDILS